MIRRLVVIQTGRAALLNAGRGFESLQVCLVFQKGGRRGESSLDKSRREVPMVVLYKLLALAWYRSLLEATTFKGTAKVCEGLSGGPRSRAREVIASLGE